MQTPRILSALIFLMLPNLLACQSQAQKSPSPTSIESLRTQKVLFDAQDKGVRVRLFSAATKSDDNLRVWVAQIDKSRIKEIALLTAPRAKPLADVLAQNKQPVHVAINGGFYENDAPMGLVMTQSKVRSPFSKRGGSGVFSIGQSAKIEHRDAYKADAHTHLALQSIDRLVDASASLVSSQSRDDKDARSAVSVNKQGVAFVVVYSQEAVEKTEGTRLFFNKKSSTTGVSLKTFAAFLANQNEVVKAFSALNLDGGYSTSFVAEVGGKSIEAVAHRATINALALPR